LKKDENGGLHSNSLDKWFLMDPQSAAVFRVGIIGSSKDGLKTVADNDSRFEN
jgi:hypothetical protein